jgi:U3 small nucleolar RNA-associated protein 21
MVASLVMRMRGGGRDDDDDDDDDDDEDEEDVDGGGGGDDDDPMYRWSPRRRTFFQSVSVDKPPSRPIEVDDPTPVAEADQALIDLFGPTFEVEPTPDLLNPDVSADAGGASEAEAPSEKGAEMSGDIGLIGPGPGGLVTLSQLPRAYWQTLFSLELIKARNRPTEAPKAPPRAPFFLPTVHNDGVNPSFAPSPQPNGVTTQGVDAGEGEDDGPMGQVWSDDDDDDDGVHGGEVMTSALNAAVLPEGGSRILKHKRGSMAKPARSQLARDLMDDKPDYAKITARLMRLSPPQIDLEMQALCLGPVDDEGVEILGAAMRWLQHEMAARRNFEVVQAYLNRFLKVYSPVLSEVSHLRPLVRALATAQRGAHQEVKGLLQHNMCLLGFFANLHGI